MIKKFQNKVTCVFRKGPLMPSWCLECFASKGNRVSFQGGILCIKHILSIITGFSDWKITKLTGCASETVHIWPKVGKAKLHLRGSRFFSFLKFCLHFLAVVYNFSNKLHTASQTHFGFTNMGSNMYCFWATVSYFCNFSNWTPCRDPQILTVLDKV